MSLDKVAKLLPNNHSADDLPSFVESHITLSLELDVTLLARPFRPGVQVVIYYHSFQIRLGNHAS